MNHLFHALWSQLSNPFVSGGLVITFTAAIVAFARNLPGRVWGAVRDQFMVNVTVVSNDPLFDWITLWLNDQPYSKRTRRLAATTIATYEANAGCAEPNSPPMQCSPCAISEEEVKRPKLILSPARGQHFFRYKGTLLWLDRSKGADDTSSSPKDQSASFRWIPESYHFRMFGRSQALLRGLLNEVIESAMKLQQKKISAFVTHYSSWRRLRTFRPRPLDSVILPAGVAENILDALKDFISRRDWYAQMGIPYHFGMLFHGIPGSGKTSIIGALAGELKMNLYILNLAGDDMSDQKLASLLSDVPPGSFMVMEDVDAAFVARTRTSEQEAKAGGGLTLTGILNALDGFMATEGSIVLMTTNHKNLLDPALIRPGRVDFEQEFSLATQEQLRRLYQRFFPNSNGDAEIWSMTMEGKTMAEAQQDLLRIKKENAAEPIKELTSA